MSVSYDNGRAINGLTQSRKRRKNFCINKERQRNNAVFA